MRLTSDNEKYNNGGMDIESVLADLQDKHRQIYWTTLDGEIFIYKPIGRKDFKDICLSEGSNEDKKDGIIQACLLYPTNFDLDDCVAGVINILYKKMIDVSYLDSEESKIGVMEYYRQDMYNLDNQITCIINEAFPQFDIEEIENWDIERTSKYLSRAEWKLQNFRNFEFNEQYFNSQFSQEEQAQEPEEIEEAPAMEIPKKEKMSPEKLRQLQAQFPEIDWANDAVSRGGIDAMADSIDTMAPALRAPR